ncbi:MAG TPA: hypothetical protein VE134_09820, partial [Methanomicrobiales archaeon]|nr:hypothetical protein [Methanomicrobiales archaeon]
IVLSRGFHIDVGIAVDTHVKRLSQRIGLSDHSEPEQIEKDLMALYPREAWPKINFTFMQHGRVICTARRPKHESCVIKEECRCYHLFHEGSVDRDCHPQDETI